MTGKSLTSPLAGIVARAAGALPQKTGETGRLRDRIGRAGADTVILADVSSSMADMAGARRKIDILREALDNVRPSIPTARVLAFGSTVTDAPASIPDPSGGTALHLALDHAASYRPRRTIVISDGEPDNEQQALDAAERLSGTIDIIYCGLDGNRRAIDFMHRLARLGGGRVVIHDLKRVHDTGATAIAASVRLLALPKA